MDVREARDVSSRRMIDLADLGFGARVPMMRSEDPSRRVELFRQFVASYAPVWRLCSDCEMVANSYLPRASREDVLEPTIGAEQRRVDAVPRRPAGMLRRIVAHRFGRRLLQAGVVIGGLMLGGFANDNYQDVIWWWQSRTAIAQAKELARTGDWQAAEQTLRGALVLNPDNPRLIWRTAIAEMMLNRSYVAGIYFRALSDMDGVPPEDKAAARDWANSIAATTRERARAVLEEAYRLQDALPMEMRRADGPAFHPFEAISIPPVRVSAAMVPRFKMESLDGTHVLCTSEQCGWAFKPMPWSEILRTRIIRVTLRAANAPCCELSIDDPGIVDPLSAIQQIERLPPEHRVRAMFGLATRLAFLANVISFNGTRR